MPDRRISLTRRQFLRTATAAAAVPYVITSGALGAAGRPPASERIVMGAIGMGGMGNGDLGSFLGFGEVQVVAVCDVVESKRLAAKERVDRKYGGSGCAAVNDFREITRREDVDAVMIATPDHWHALPAIDACTHGKDVYCQKPLSLTVREGRAMVAAARKYGCVFSGGSQRVLGDYGHMARAVRSGAIGRVQEAFVGVGGPSRPCDLPAEPVPPGLDWDLWLGPAPWAPFHSQRLRFRAWRDYSGGGMTDWGAHKFAGAMFAMELHDTGPVEVVPPDGGEHKHLTYVFAGGVRMYHGGARDITFRGTRGELSERRPQVAHPAPMPGYRGRGIRGDFLHCVRTRERPFRDVEFSHRSATVCHLGNIAYRLKRPLTWDPVREECPGDDEANRLLDRPKREPWRL